MLRPARPTIIIYLSHKYIMPKSSYYISIARALFYCASRVSLLRLCLSSLQASLWQETQGTCMPSHCLHSRLLWPSCQPLGQTFFLLSSMPSSYLYSICHLSMLRLYFTLKHTCCLQFGFFGSLSKFALNYATSFSTSWSGAFYISKSFTRDASFESFAFSVIGINAASVNF